MPRFANFTVMFAGGVVSSEADMGAHRLKALRLPAEWAAGGDVTFVSDGMEVWTRFDGLYTVEGDPSRHIEIDPGALLTCQRLRLVSTLPQTATVDLLGIEI